MTWEGFVGEYAKEIERGRADRAGDPEGRPPLGLIPKEYVLQDRNLEIVYALGRYLSDPRFLRANKEGMRGSAIKWTRELLDNLEWLREDLGDL